MPSPILTIAEMRAWEQAASQTGVTEEAVISKVGEALARILISLTKTGDRILVVAGKGNNGADARACVPHLANRVVDTLNVSDPVAGKDEFIRLAQTKPAWVVDGLFGIGLDRPLSPEWTGLIQAINHSNLPILAVDVPSGLNADSGANWGGVIAAAVTAAVGAPKVGMIATAAADCVGRIEVLTDVGLAGAPKSSADLYWTLPGDFAGYPPRRHLADHKGGFGHVSIMAGSLGYHGAAVLAAKGALRARPGLVTLVTLPSAYIPAASLLASAMVHRWRAKQSLPEKTTCVLAGPGLAGTQIPSDFRDWVQRSWKEYCGPVVVDASALDWLPARAVGPRDPRVVTPHPGEAARMLKIKPDAVQANRVGAMRELSRIYGDTWVVLKGHQTLIGRGKGPIYVNSTGNPGLAQGGTGDVLSGFLGGLMAQPELLKNPELTIRYAVWAHGLAGDRLEARRANWCSEDLADAIGDRI